MLLCSRSGCCLACLCLVIGWGPALARTRGSLGPVTLKPHCQLLKLSCSKPLEQIRCETQSCLFLNWCISTNKRARWTRLMNAGASLMFVYCKKISQCSHAWTILYLSVWHFRAPGLYFYFFQQHKLFLCAYWIESRKRRRTSNFKHHFIFLTEEERRIRANFLSVCCGKIFQRLTVFWCCCQEVMRRLCYFNQPPQATVTVTLNRC